jgi:S1-C subfamily serine protease
MRLTYESGEHAGRTIDLEPRRMVVGRGGGSDIVLHADTEVSRRHASLEARSDGTLVVTDLGSTNGTFVDGRRIDGSVSLRGGERVRIGETTLLVEGPREARAVPPPAQAAAPVPFPPPVRPLGEGAGPGQPLGQGAPHRAQPPPGSPLPVPPKPPSASMLERMRLRQAVIRANLLASAAIALAILVIGAVAVLALTGALSGGGDGRQPLSTEQIVEAVTPSTVDILSRQTGRRYAGGTGWVLDSRQGLIATNSHVVNGGDSWAVKVGDEERTGSFVAAAPCEDQAVLRLRDTTGLRTMPLGDQRLVKAGQGVVAIGFPVNASSRDNLTATAGVVSVPRTVFTGAFDVPDLSNVIQTDAAINPGNSGGPLVSFRSQLIGMDTAGLDEAGGRTIQGQGYAIGVDRIKQVMAKLRRGRSMGYTGFGIDPQEPRETAPAGLPRGLHTVEAIPGSPADRAGFGDGEDRTIVAVGGERLNGSLPQYCRVVEGYRSGQSATFTLGEKGGRTQAVRLKFM